MVKPVWNNAKRVNHQNFPKTTHPYAKKNLVPRAVLMKSGLVSINTARQNISKIAVLVNTARQVNAAHSKTTVNAARPMSYLSKTAHSTVKRPIHKNTTFKNNNINQRVNTVRGKKFNTARPKAVGNPQIDLQDQGVIDSGCGKVPTWNMSYLTDYEEIDGGYVAFGGNPKGGKITRKCTIKTDPKSFHDDGSKPSSDDGKKVDEDPRKDSKCNDQEKEDNVNSTNTVNAAGTNKVNVVGGKTSIELPFDLNMPALEDYSIFDLSKDDEDDGAEANMNNLVTTIQVSPIPTTRIHKDHPLDQVIRDLQSATQTRKMSKNLKEHGFVSTVQQRTNHKDLQNCLFACFLSQEEPKKAYRKKSIPRKSTRKRQKMEEDAEKEELKGFLDIIPREEVPIEVESLSTKFPIVDWKTCVLTENFMYYQIFRGDGSSKNYKILSEMLEDFDRQDVEELYRLVKERYSTSRPEGYDLMLWGDLHTLFEPDEEDELWKNQHEYNVISWSLYDFCGIHILLMQNGIAIHMLTEKKYPLSQEMISKMLKKKLEVDHESSQAFELLRFIRSQVQK
ncbi:hypothetical protein Tco_0153352 [Tanacetum coccineum]